EIAVLVDDGVLEVEVTDDGTGLPPHRVDRGLRNLAERAERLDGRLSVRSPTRPGGGTRLSWRVPLPLDTPQEN
ncbi:ATP-binding protein, partial [Streptomyces roseolus]